MAVALKSALTWFWQAADCLKIRSKLSSVSAAMANKVASTWGRDTCCIHLQHRQWKEEITQWGPNSAALAIMLSNAERTRVNALTDMHAQMDMWGPSEGFKCRYKHNSPGLVVSECRVSRTLTGCPAENQQQPLIYRPVHTVLSHRVKPPLTSCHSSENPAFFLSDRHET